MVEIILLSNGPQEVIDVYRLSDGQLIKTISLSNSACEVNLICGDVYLEAGKYAYVYTSGVDYIKDIRPNISFRFYPGTGFCQSRHSSHGNLHLDPFSL